MSIYITPHFKWSEALDTDIDLPNLPSDYAKANLVQTFRILEHVRCDCNFPLVINSAFRTLQVHKRIYELQNKTPNTTSYHLDGRAVDISIIDLSEEQINKLFNSLQSYMPVEIYKTGTFVHVAF